MVYVVFRVYPGKNVAAVKITTDFTAFKIGLLAVK